MQGVPLPGILAKKADVLRRGEGSDGIGMREGFEGGMVTQMSKGMARQWTSGMLPVIRCFVRCFFGRCLGLLLVPVLALVDDEEELLSAIVVGDSDASLLAAVRTVVSPRCNSFLLCLLC